jgi:hypothetical protein
MGLVIDVGVEKVSKILGYSDINLTVKRYAHLKDFLNRYSGKIGSP